MPKHILKIFQASFGSTKTNHLKIKCLIIPITPSMTRKKQTHLNSSSALGCDGVTVRHISLGETDILIDLLSDLYSLILSRNIVPDIFKLGVIVPIRRSHL